MLRLKKLVADQEENIHRKDVLNQTLTQEIETLRKDADVQSRTLRELKEILQTHVKPAGPVQVRHRAGNMSFHLVCFVWEGNNSC